MKSKPPKRPPSKGDSAVWKDDLERMEMNHVAEAPREDRDYVDLEPPYNTGSRALLLTPYHCSSDTSSAQCWLYILQ